MTGFLFCIWIEIYLSIYLMYWASINDNHFLVGYP